MSAVTALPVLGSPSQRVGADSYARVIDINEERRRRISQLDQAVRRHPASVARTLRPAAHAGSAAVAQATTGKPTAPVAVPTVRALRAPTAQNRVDGPVTYAWVVPAYAKVVGWVAALALVVSGAAGLGHALRPAPYSGQTWTHTVAAGESLWGLAASIDSKRPLEDVVEDIRALNGLTEGALLTGQELTLPVD